MQLCFARLGLPDGPFEITCYDQKSVPTFAGVDWDVPAQQ